MDLQVLNPVVTYLAATCQNTTREISPLGTKEGMLNGLHVSSSEHNCPILSDTCKQSRTNLRTSYLC